MTSSPDTVAAFADLSLIRLEQPAPFVWLITMNHRAKRNALSLPLLGEIEQVLLAARDSDAVRAVVLTGGNDFFSAGADIADMAARGVDAYADPLRLARWKTIETFPKPLIAAVNGFAIGGGSELMMLADIIIAARDASISQREIAIGGLPGDGATQRLPRLLGKALAMKMILTGEPLPAVDAERFGLVSELAEPARTIPRAIEIAAQIAAHAPLSVKLAKRAVLASFETGLQEGLSREIDINREGFATEDRAEGMRAFMEKRTPRFTGR
ncbi:MAG TPA: enoyl-CoA hydratase-related protein [Bordetella sp.]|nr:enoyl-CoA hydratase-related protein [Bordetella sp.]